MNELPRNQYGRPVFPALPEPSPIVASYLKMMRNYPAVPMAGRTAIDLGCGRGRNSIALAKRRFKVLGVDVNAEDLRIAETRRNEQHIGELSCEFMVADITSLPDLEAPFDTKFNVVAANEVLHNLPKSDQYDLLSDMRRRTSHGGVHLISGYVLEHATQDDGNQVQAHMLNPGELHTMYADAGWMISRYRELDTNDAYFDNDTVVSSRAHLMAVKVKS